MLSHRFSSVSLTLLVFLLCASTWPLTLASPRPKNVFSSLLTPSSPCLNGAPTPLFSPSVPRCDSGFYCPHLNASDPATWPTRCPPTLKCKESLASGEGCDPQGFYDPSICAPGFYCPQTWIQLECPSGYYCPAGSSAPRACPPLSMCAAGSEGPFYFGGFIAILFLDLGFWAAVKLYRRWIRQKQSAAEARFHASTRSRPKTGSSGLVVTTAELCEGFDRARRVAPIKELTFKLDKIRLEIPAAIGSATGKSNSASSSIAAVFNKFISKIRSLNNEAKRLFRIVFPDVSAAASHSARSVPDSSDLAQSAPGSPTVLLNSVSATFSSGTMTAVLGGSGAGKSTLFAAINGKIDPSWRLTGSFTVNGDSVISESSSQIGSSDSPPSQRVINSLLAPLIGFVPQSDICHRELTVYDNIWYSAMIRLPKDWTMSEKVKHVQVVIRALGLEHVAHQVVGDEFERGISGGERKRVNIGIELAAAPLALLLDEPTSGLDPSASLALCSLLKEIASTANITVAMIIHQPRVEIWSSLDQVLLLGRGGHTVYYGPQAAVKPYFQSSLAVTFPRNTNPADIIMDAMDKNGEKFAKMWRDQGRDVSMNSASSIGNKEKEEKSNSIAIASSTSPSTAIPKEIEMETIRVAVAPKGAGTGSAVSGSAEHSILVADSASAGSSVPISSLNPAQVRGLRGAPFWQQVLLAHQRGVKQILSNPTSIFFECLICFIVSAILSGPGATFYGVWRDEYSTLSPKPSDGLNENALYFVFALASAASTPGVYLFAGPEMPVYWREASSGHSRLAYFIGKVSSSIYRYVFAALHMGCVIAFLAQLQFSYGSITFAFILTMWVIYGLCSIAAHIFRPVNAPLVVIIACVLMSTTNGLLRGIYPEFIKKFFFPFYLAELWTSYAVDSHRDVYNISAGKLNVEGRYGYNTDQPGFDWFMLFLFGLVYHSIGYIAMTRTNKEKQGNF